MSGAIDVSEVLTMIGGNVPAVVSVASAVLTVWVGIVALRWIREALGYGGGSAGSGGVASGGGASGGGFEGDWAGYSAADDARDRMAHGLAPNPNWVESYNAQVDAMADDEERRLAAKDAASSGEIKMPTLGKGWQ
jgi:hypothetical protein